MALDAFDIAIGIALGLGIAHDDGFIGQPSAATDEAAFEQSLDLSSDFESTSGFQIMEQDNGDLVAFKAETLEGPPIFIAAPAP